jgi:hypothetical protein
MFKHEWYRFVILRHAMNGNTGRERTGWPTTLGTLGQFISQAGLDSSGREPVDALMWLQERNLIALKKTTPKGTGYLIYDYSEYDEKKFFWGQFGICVTPEGSAYFNELEAKAYAAMQAAAPIKQNNIGFHA